MKREFSSLTPKEALHVAMFIEERNADIYAQFAELFDGFNDPESAEIASTFWDMAEEERKHGADLHQRYQERYGNEPCPITEEEIRETIEVPKFESGNIFAIARAQVSPAPRNNALEVALAAEKSAMKFYTRLVEFTDDPELRHLYEELASDETDHTRALQRRLRLGKRAGSITQA